MDHKNAFFWQNLSWIMNEDKGDSILDLNIPDHVETLLIYNTNDLWLSENQFNALMESIRSPEKIYVAQNDSDEIVEVSFPMSYKEYCDLDLYSLTYVTSNHFDWLLIMDEGIESGIGVLATKNELIGRYCSRYTQAKQDIQDLIAFHHRDASRNPYSIECLNKILSLWHEKK